MAILYPEPIQAFRFLVRVGDSEEISAAFSRFSGIQMQVETIQARDGSDARGVKEYTPVFTSYEPVTLSKGVVGDNELLDWMLAASAGTKLPICAISTMRAVCRNRADLPAMLGPVIIMICCLSLSSSTLLLT